MPARLLDKPTLLALLRVVQRQPPESNDFELVFDLFGVALSDRDQVIRVAYARFLLDEQQRHCKEHRETSVLALLRDMVQAHVTWARSELDEPPDVTGNDLRSRRLRIASERGRLGAS